MTGLYMYEYFNQCRDVLQHLRSLLCLMQLWPRFANVMTHNTSSVTTTKSFIVRFGIDNLPPKVLKVRKLI